MEKSVINMHHFCRTAATVLYLHSFWTIASINSKIYYSLFVIGALFRRIYDSKIARFSTYSYSIRTCLYLPEPHCRHFCFQHDECKTVPNKRIINGRFLLFSCFRSNETIFMFKSGRYLLQTSLAVKKWHVNVGLG